MNFQSQIDYLIQEAKNTNKTCIAVLPNLYGKGTTTWQAKPEENGGISVTFEINNLSTKKK